MVPPISGIFIKHVMEGTPAAQSGDLMAGDQILEVNGMSLRDATHDEAVDVIRRATSPVRLIVQTLPARQLNSLRRKSRSSRSGSSSSATVSANSLCLCLVSIFCYFICSLHDIRLLKTKSKRSTWN